MMSQVASSLPSVGLILAVLAAVAAVELVLPLHARHRWNVAHLVPNLALTFLTFATNLFFNGALVIALIWLEGRDVGLLHVLDMPSVAAGAVAVVALDFAFYMGHRAMHGVPVLWRFHLVHHSDPAVDVTTTIRQHPGESVVRYALMAVCACTLGASPAVFAVYRLWSVLNGLAEHANVKMPRRLDSILSVIVTTPNMHKVHHSRAQQFTDTNFGNIFSVFDRAFSTFTPSRRGEGVQYGLDGLDQPALQTTRALLAAPFRPGRHAPLETRADVPSS